MKRCDVYTICDCGSYNTKIKWEENPTGDWVKWSDVEKLLALREAEAAEVKAFRGLLGVENHEKLGAFVDEVQLATARANEMLVARVATDAARRAAGIMENTNE